MAANRDNNEKVESEGRPEELRPSAHVQEEIGKEASNSQRTPPEPTVPLDAWDRAQSAYIEYPRLGMLIEDIKECQELSRRAKSPLCMSLEGPTGAGKTTLIMHYLDKFPREVIPGATSYIPVLYVLVDSPVTVRTMSETMLKTLGDLEPRKGSQGALNDRIVEYLKKVRCELVILDDFHNLTLTQTEYIFKSVSHWLKAIIKRSDVPFLVIGIEGQVDSTLDQNAELSRFFPVRETLSPFAFDTKVTATVKEFDRFVGHVENVLDMKLDPGIRRTDLLYRVHYATFGVVSNIMLLFTSAQRRALAREADHIDVCDLAQAFHKHLQKHTRRPHNPFEERSNGGLAYPISRLPAQEVLPPVAARSGRGRSRGPRNDEGADVLNAP